MKSFFLFFACLTSISLVAAQEVLNWKDDEIVSPVVNADNTLTISLFAPNAKKVELTGNFLYAGKETPDKYADGDWSPQLMNKDTNGQWTLTTAPLKPEFYSYNLTKVSHPLKHQLFSFSFVCLPPYPLTVNTCLTEVMQTIHILRPIFPMLQPLQGFCSTLYHYR